MAAVSASFVRVAAASAALQPACAHQKLIRTRHGKEHFSLKSVATAASRSSSKRRSESVARFNGLKAFPSLRQRAIVLRPAAIRRAIISASGAEESTLSKVQNIIIEQLACDREKVVPSAKFADLGADSLDTVEIMMALEEEFQITLDEDNAGKISTVQEAADLIQSFIVKS